MKTIAAFVLVALGVIASMWLVSGQWRGEAREVEGVVTDVFVAAGNLHMEIDGAEVYELKLGAQVPAHTIGRRVRFVSRGERRIVLGILIYPQAWDMRFVDSLPGELLQP